MEYDYFGKWLVLGLADTRKVYLPVSAISVIEEVAERGQEVRSITNGATETATP